MNLDEWTDGTSQAKPWLNVVVNNVNAGVLTCNRFKTSQTLTVKFNRYLWTAGDAFPTPDVIPSAVFCITGGAFTGTLHVPSTASLDTYFGTTSSVIVFNFEVLNATTATYPIAINNVPSVVIPAGTAASPSYSKYYFGKLVSGGDYVCWNVNATPG